MQSFGSLYAPRKKSISLTALIDVVFILLMFFMLTSTFVKWQAVTLQAPILAPEQSQSSEALPQFLRLSPVGSIELINSPFKLASFKHFSVDHLPAFEVDQPVYLMPEGEVSLQRLVDALEWLKARGLPSVVLGDVFPEASAR